MTVQLCAFVNVHKNVVLQITENDKVLAWCELTPAQAKGVAAQIHELANMAWSYENHRAEDATKKEPARGPRPGRGYHEEDAESNEEGS